MTMTDIAKNLQQLAARLILYKKTVAVAIVVIISSF